MSEENQAPKAETKEVVTIQAKIGNNPNPFILEEATQKKRNSEEHLVYYVPKLTTWASLTILAQAVGEALFLGAVVREVVVPAFKESSAEAVVETVNPATGEKEPKFSVAKLVSNLIDWFQPASRRQGGLTASEIRVKMCTLVPELTMLATKPNPTPEEKNRGLVLMAELNDLSAQLAKKSRPATAPKAKAA